MRLVVDPENREKFEKTALQLHTMIRVMGWDMMAEMWARGTPPFTDPLKGNFRQRKKEAKRRLQRWAIEQLKEAGLRRV